MQDYLRLKYNVISVDYAKGARFPCYPMSVKNGEIVGRCLANLISFLINTPIKSRKITMKDMHVVGFSMGAHVSAIAAVHLSKKGLTFDRITGIVSSILN